MRKILPVIAGGKTVESASLVASVLFVVFRDVRREEMGKRFLGAALALMFMAGAAYAGDESWDVSNPNVVESETRGNTLLFTSSPAGAVAPQDIADITINEHMLTIGGNHANGYRLNYQADAITSAGAASSLAIVSADLAPLGGFYGTTVTLDELNFGAGGTVVLDSGVDTGADANRLIVGTFSAGNTATFNIADNAIFQIQDSATFAGGSSLIAAAAGNSVLLDAGAQLIVSGGNLAGTAAFSLNIANTDPSAGVGQVVFQGTGS